MNWISAYIEHFDDLRRSRLGAAFRKQADAKWDGVVALIDEIRKQAWSPEPVRLHLPDRDAHAIADALEHWMDHEMPLYRAQVAIQENIIRASQVADEMMRDELQRFAMAVTDLELLLMQFIGRPPMTMEEVRRQRTQMEARPSSGPQPFRRSKPTIQISEELRRSVRSGSIGDPRKPGEEG